MTGPEPFDPLDPFAVHFHREPLEGAGVALILLAVPAEEPDESALAPCAGWLREQGRRVETLVVIVDRDDPGLNDRIGEALASVDQPIVAILSAAEAPSPALLKPLLKAINQADHVIGKRPAGPLVEALRWLVRIPRRLVFAVPVLDVNSPCRLHRLEKLRAIPLQSGSSFVNTEALAKATFLGHLLDEVAIPPLKGRVWRKGWLRDLRTVFSHPTFRPPAVAEPRSGPLEQPEGQPEGADRPGGEDGERHQDLGLGDPSALQNDQPQGAHELGQG